MSVCGPVTEDFPDAGQRLAAELGKTLPGVQIEPSAVYAGAATEVLIDAIARSDATRPWWSTSCSRPAPGQIGRRVRFDRNGDPGVGPVTILRIEPGARELPTFPDATPAGVVRPLVGRRSR